MIRSINDSNEEDEKPENAKTHELEEESLWWTIPDLVLLKILSLLNIKDVASVTATCRRWYELANDDLMWKRRFQEHFRTDPAIPLKPGMYDRSTYMCIYEYVKVITSIVFTIFNRCFLLEK